MKYILIILVVIGTYRGGTSVTSVEFGSKYDCEIAAVAIRKREDHPTKIDTICVPYKNEK